MHDADQFLTTFLGELARDGHSPEQASHWVWRAFNPAGEPMLGPTRRTDLAHLAMTPTDCAQRMQAATPGRIDHRRLALILVPGFTHETLRNLSWHEEVQRRDGPQQVTMLHCDRGGTVQETRMTRGEGLPCLYLKYPRSNASSEIILPGMARLLAASATLQRWIAEGRRIVFVGYSNGAPLSLELLAALNQGREDVPGLLQNTRGMLSLCGDVGGSYLADDIVSEQPQFLSLARLIEFAGRHRLIARLIGLGTAQLREDMFDGVVALGHAHRQSVLMRIRDELPAHLHYFSLAAMLPLGDYRRHWYQFNLDDIAMYRQALITNPITAYQDGQVALPDNLIPTLPRVPAEQQHYLGTVRTHHWGVSYRTFNFGVNRFPRRALYRALLQMIDRQLDG